jgi:hypothetical protein
MYIHLLTYIYIYILVKGAIPRMGKWMKKLKQTLVKI